MNLTLAILIPGLLLLSLGAPLALFRPGAGAGFQAFLRSRFAAWGCFGSGTVWFLDHVWHLPVSDHGEYHVPLFFAFGAAAVLAARSAPDFLGVRGLSILVLLAVAPLLRAGYMDYDYPAIYVQKGFLYLCIVLAIWLGAQPWRLRDFLGWLLARTYRARGCGGAMIAYGLWLCAIASSHRLSGN